MDKIKICYFLICGIIILFLLIGWCLYLASYYFGKNIGIIIFLVILTILILFTVFSNLIVNKFINKLNRSDSLIVGDSPPSEL